MTDALPPLIPNVAQRLLDQTPAAWDNAWTLRSLLRIFGDGQQDLEFAGNATLGGLLFDSATGPHLEAWADRVGEPDVGDPDAVYRQRVRARLLINASSGTTPQMLEILLRLTSAEETWHFTVSVDEVAFHYERRTTTTAARRTRVLELLIEAAPAGTLVGPVCEHVEGFAGWDGEAGSDGWFGEWVEAC